MKKIIIILIVLILISVTGWFAYVAFSSKDVEDAVGDSIGFFGKLFSEKETSSLGSVDKNTQGGEEDFSGFLDEDLTKLQFGESVLQKITSSPVTGLVATTTNGSSYVRYIDRATGNVYEYSTLSGELKRITNTTIPGVYEAVWNDASTAVTVRYLDEDDVIKSFSAQVEDSSPSPLNGRFLPNDIDFLTRDDNGENLFYTVRGDRETLLRKSGFDGFVKETVYRSFLNEVVYRILGNGTIFFTTKASSLVPGLAYRLSSEEPRLPEKILGGIYGLTTNISPIGDIFLFSQSLTDTFQMYSFDVVTREARVVSTRTLPEKCAWSKSKSNVVYCGVPNNIPKGLYPDSWYQGEVSFLDNIWEIDVFRNVTYLLVDLSKESDVSLDVVSPTLSESEDYMFFINKKDSSLWSLRLPN